MNILYLCGSGRDLQYTMRRWLAANRSVIARVDERQRIVETRSGLRIVFHTYSDPDRLRGTEFDAVFRSDGRIEASMAQEHATEELVRTRVR